MGQEGKITAAAIIDALNKRGDAVNEQFGKLAPTIGQGMTMVENSFTRMIGKVDQASGASRRRWAMRWAASAASLTGRCWRAPAAVRHLGRDIQRCGEQCRQAEREAGRVGNGAKSISWYITNAFIEMPANVKAMIGITTTHIAAFIDDTSNRFERAKDRWNAIWTSSTWADAQKAYESRSKPSRAPRSEHRRHPEGARCRDRGRKCQGSSGSRRIGNRRT